ncbi:hypothetical protein [Streptomyces johnsoniae]|uniref:Uncharacterized protein n=1 Tax=Streptomyces johnsoniae TaxID=3075532 RepID=A0ABU2RZV6_9ACTN|nr:hypothetical protein [Streptomyces sp. DSM 41886]MDT0442296.1 hypothetical protein [Streptomyces sp. DSM 41886]
MIAEWGIFKNDRMLRQDLYSQEGADACLAAYKALKNDDTLVVRELCPEHRDVGQPRGDCEECRADELWACRERNHD